MGFDLSQYETVAERQAKWWDAHPEGRILTKVVSADGQTVCVRAELYRDSTDERPYATGYAEEVRGSSNVNKTSALENCETSAIGRALAAAGLAGSDPAKRPSREEMEKVERNHGQGPRPESTGTPSEGDEQDAWRDVILNPDGWFDNEGKEKGPRFKAKNTNRFWGKADEYQGKPTGLALWKRDMPPNFMDAWISKDVALYDLPADPKAVRGSTVEAAVELLGGTVEEEVPFFAENEEPF